MTKPYRVCVMGTPLSSGNRGVLALGASLVSLCMRAAANVEVTLLVGHSNNKPVSFLVGSEMRRIPVVNWRLSPRARLCDNLAWIVAMALLYRAIPIGAVRRAIARATPWIDALAEADLVGDIRGGDSFSDIYGMQRFVRGFLTAWTVLAVKGTMVQFPQTYGPYKSPLARWMARYLLLRSSTIIARDENSRKVAQELVGAAKEVLLSPDVAFSLEAVRPAEIALDPPLVGPAPRVIGLNVNGLMYNGGYTRKNQFGLKLDYPAFLTGLAERLLERHDGELWLVPHNFAPDGSVESDPEMSYRLRSQLPAELQKRVRVVAKAYSQHEIKGVIGCCDFFIGSRMHACIAALSQGVPCVGVAYSGKFAGVFRSMGMGDWVIDGRDVSGEEALARILSLYDGRAAVRGELVRNCESARVRLGEVFRGLVAGGERPELRYADSLPVRG